MTLKEIQSFSLDILKDVHSFCIARNIKYSLAYGTLIGAIRHKGFIPWDDDIDIMMPRDDFDLFCKTYKSKKFRIASPYDEKCWISFARVYDSDRTYVDSPCEWGDFESGVWIDIFPLDGADDEIKIFKKDAERARWLWMKQVFFRDAKSPFVSRLSFLFNFKLLIKKIFFRKNQKLAKINFALTQNAKRYKFGETNHWTQFVCMDDRDRNYQLIEDFASVYEMPFEEQTFMVLNGYDRYLRTIYGDYTKLPPECDRVPKQYKMKFYWK
ncbi:phosphorylcholine transferase LicD [Fibrobacter sp. HC4]|uniref:LicD family protein n=1 Tax=Fibrobacter sp. HC4 TaxID=3239812 RepID=UPI0020187500|nr:LicD family protein [Fibrobacter succinogenes]MCL4100574.1 hypothetical protein [Fibrobacter succinogenes]